jgi:hypothetical protein
MTHFNGKLIACVNIGITPSSKIVTLAGGKPRRIWPYGTKVLLINVYLRRTINFPVNVAREWTI